MKNNIYFRVALVVAVVAIWLLVPPEYKIPKSEQFWKINNRGSAMMVKEYVNLPLERQVAYLAGVSDSQDYLLMEDPPQTAFVECLNNWSPTEAHLYLIHLAERDPRDTYRSNAGAYIIDAAKQECERILALTRPE